MSNEASRQRHERLVAIYAARHRSGADAAPRRPSLEEMSRGNDRALAMLKDAARIEELAGYADSGAAETADRDRARTLRDMALRIARGQAEPVACPECNRTVYRTQALRGWTHYELGRYLHPHSCTTAPEEGGIHG
ncbi:MAG: hypothetical protein V2J24_23725 [Pseudomonadales bacterium]|jgi:hypothetical protein|nr:hypothetical protein [Pseudomonadales bacterium]